jgi:hypothetical protein
LKIHARPITCSSYWNWWYHRAARLHIAIEVSELEFTVSHSVLKNGWVETELLARMLDTIVKRFALHCTGTGSDALTGMSSAHWIRLVDAAWTEMNGVVDTPWRHSSGFVVTISLNII